MKIRAKENLKWRDEDVCFTVYSYFRPRGLESIFCR